MGIKSNLRSFRYSDSVGKILDNYGCGSLNENFERLVYDCKIHLPEIRKEVAELEELRDNLRNEITQELNIQIAPRVVE